MPKRKRGLTTEEIQKVLADLEDEIFDDSDSDCELENEEDDLDQSLNLNPEVEDEVVSEEQSKIVWDDPQLTHKATILPFTGKNVIKGAAVPSVTESDFFNCIFKNSIVRKITEETNIYATRVLQSATPSSLRKHNPGWTETSEEEILKFLSLILLMGHVDKDNIKEYWSTDPMLETPF
ncbi:piggyBac transposable element-derived protein 4 [Trichonephila clavipes]|nr:piggyBac transposable element-derived protein 4 [Trichonephila clavipes]